MRSAFLLTFATLVACTPSSGPSGDPNTDTTETTTTTTTETVPTVPLGTDLGSLMLVRTEQKQGVTVELMGLFVNTHPGFYNLAQCAITGGICFDLLPTVEDDAEG